MKKDTNKDKIEFHYYGPERSIFSFTASLNRSISYDVDYGLFGERFEVPIIEKNPKIKRVLKTTDSDIWDGIGGAIFFPKKIAEPDPKELTKIVIKTLKDQLQIITNHRSNKLVNKKHIGVYPDRKTITYTFGNYFRDPLSYYGNSIAIYLKGVDEYELKIIAKSIIKKFPFVAILVHDLNINKYYQVSIEHEKPPKKIVQETDTLVIHPHDQATEHLKRVYQGKPFHVIRQTDIPFSQLVAEIKKHQTIILIGKGKGHLLINPKYHQKINDNNRYIIDKSFESYFKGKKIIKIR